MADRRFFPYAGPFRLAEIAEMTGAELRNCPDPSLEVTGVAALDRAVSGDLGFLENRRYLSALGETKASACFVAAAFVDRAPPELTLLVTDRPRRNFARISRLFHPEDRPEPGIHQSAIVADGVRLGEGCRVDAGAVIDADVEIGDGAWIGPNVVIGKGVTIGAGTRVDANASLSHCDIGARCLIYPGARVGQPGFGFEVDASGPLKMPQLGRVIIEDDVEVGANTTVDRGAGPDTVIGRGTMIDNLVQIGHNVEIGKGCIIVAQVGIAGSTKLEDYVVLGGQVGVAGHITIGTGAQVAAQSGVNKGVPAGARMGGSPTVPMREFRRQVAAVKALGRRVDKSDQEDN
ncbi:MAG: UDP-3-O-(3-hydroxymyristoyl)glucosamine N-acyltransferase [Alphaproteobacteria bacterium]|jgi:UDP-3-O-[3-hydroxymyristoyl] glucosamine N-acyltransferase|nr:UDP-3-O-(3-hydroxymyristoyl)glucosamine N-acyltransferase [Alphaproteobacteria bacterium]